MSNEELGAHLNRSKNAIMQRLNALDLHRPKEIHNYETLNNYVRAKLTPWKQNVRKEADFVCSVRGVRGSNIVVHHCRSFNLLMAEAMEDVGLEYRNEIDDYTQQELDSLVEYFLYLQEYYGEYCCVSEDIHILFHRMYGFGNNTIEQWNEFVEKYKSGCYEDKVA